MPDLSPTQFKMQHQYGSTPRYGPMQEQGVLFTGGHQDAWEQAEDPPVHIPKTTLHYTHEPDFKIDPQHDPYLAESHRGSGAALFGTNKPHTWRHWTELRSYAARIGLAGVGQRDVAPPQYGAEVVLKESGARKAQLLGVHPARIFRSHLESPENYAIQHSKEIFTDRRRGPRQPRLPGMKPEAHEPRGKAQATAASRQHPALR